MSDSQNWNSVGEQIKNALSGALQTGDFTDLNELVSQTVTDTLSDAGKHIAESFSGQLEKKQEEDRNKAGMQEKARLAKEKQEQQRKLIRQQQREAQHKRRKQQQAARAQFKAKQLSYKHTKSEPNTGQAETGLIPVNFRHVGRVSNVLYQVFGGIGLGLSSLIALIRIPVALIGETTAAGWIINLLFIAAFFGMIRFGIGQRDRLKRAKRYIQLCGGQMYGQIEALARDTGRSIRFVAKDIRRMLHLGMFPEGHLDDKKTCFMLNDSVHRQYLEAEQSRLIREREKAQKAENRKKQNEGSGEADAGQEEALGNEQEAELNTMIAEGMECTRKLRRFNDQIPGEVISEKLYRLENLLKDIFDSVREHPEQMHRMHKMMDYYLPTTLKLVEAYADFDKVSVPGPEIVAAKAEIERTMDIINQAFSELLSNLFQDTVLDITTDAQVLQTMLAREGLTKNI